MGKFDDAGLEPVLNDPYAELFADCRTVEDVLELCRDIAEAERW